MRENTLAYLLSSSVTKKKFYNIDYNVLALKLEFWPNKLECLSLTRFLELITIWALAYQIGTLNDIPLFGSAPSLTHRYLKKQFQGQTL